ncbi:MAG: LytTR family transcriptional regulator [Psychroserpens sp.]|nr:LytTR family transcriptional regulator [Psychroserpens sp.]
MINTASQHTPNYNTLAGTHKILGILLVVFLSIITLTVFQDFLESNRSGYSFYISESILFKTIWFLFIPLLAVLHRLLKNQKVDSFGKVILYIAASIATHLIVLSFIFALCSVIFFNGDYSMYKIVSYTLANDFYKLVIVYAAFVLAHKYLFNESVEIIPSNEKKHVEKIYVTNGQLNIVVNTTDIYLITAETPYIAIQLESKKHLHSDTLKSIATKLNSQTFIRVHKSTIVNLDKVDSFKSRLNGDYDIVLKNGEEIRLSRTYAANFKRQFKTHRVTI